VISISSLVIKQCSFFPTAEYRDFKESFFREIMFVQELRKESRGAMSATRRLYAVYGNDGTGMLYRCVLEYGIFLLTFF